MMNVFQMDKDVDWWHGSCAQKREIDIVSVASSLFAM
jgi:hypothetical protein